MCVLIIYYCEIKVFFLIYFVFKFVEEIGFVFEMCVCVCELL